MSRTRSSIFARAARRMFPRVPDFHALIEDQCQVAVAALEALVAFAEQGTEAAGDRVRALEKEGDRLRLRNIAILDRAFATPMDRESIYAAVIAIDDVVNYAKTTVREVDIFSVVPDAPMAAMAEELLAGGRALREGFTRLRDDPAAAARCAASVHKAERNIEKAYRTTVADLFADDEFVARLHRDGSEAVAEAFERLLDALRRREVYRHISNAADRLDAAGRALHDIVIGNV